MNKNLRRLLGALYLELERQDWWDSSAIELDDDETDFDFDYIPGEDVTIDEVGGLDETDYGGDAWPICVECGNFSPSCVCS